MCFNSTVSIITYLIAMFGSYQLYNMHFLPEAIFYGWVAQMQLFEFFLWKLQPCNSNIPNSNEHVINKNKHLTKIANLFNHLEPFVLWLSIVYFSKIRLSDNITNYMYLYIIITILYTYNVIKTSECTTVTEESKPHLHWKWNDGKYNILFYFLFLFTLIILVHNGLPYPRNIINSVIILISYILSLYMYYDKHSVGAMWCFAAAFAPYVLILSYNKYNK